MRPWYVSMAMDPMRDVPGPSRQHEWEAVYRANAGRLGRLARLLLRDPEEAQEVVQEVFLKVAGALDRLERPRAWDPWLTRLTINACRDRYRSGWWRLWRRRRARLEAIEVVDPRPTPDREAAGAEARDRLWAAFQRLPARQREVFALRHFEGWSTELIAESLGLSPGSVKTHLFRAVHRLRAALGDQR